MLKFKSIFERMFWNNVAILVLVFISVSVSMTVFINQYIISQRFDLFDNVREMIEYDTARMHLDTDADTDDGRAMLAYKRNLELWSRFTDADITVATTSGTVLASTAGIESVPASFTDKINMDTPIRKRDHFDGFYEKSVMVFGLPLHYNGIIIGAVYFTQGFPLLYRNMFELLLLFIVASAFSIVAAFFIVYRQSRVFSTAVKKINGAAMDIAAGNFDKRVEVTGNDEIGQLASSFNYMAASLGKLDDMRTRFISDVSHELRTPMTSISGFVQGILDGTIPPEKHDEYLHIVLDESKRLSRMTNDMLEMSKLSSGEYKLKIREFDLTEVIRLSIIQLESRIEEKNLGLEVDFEADKMPVLADRDAIQRVVINLLDNAVKFSYPNTAVSIKVWKQDNKVLTSVTNLGDGIDSKDLSSVFDRFYKTDRSRTGDRSGAGLGLSFVKKIIVHHKQGIWVESDFVKDGSNLKYTKFTFTLEQP